jgi:hypothetical protein
MLANLKMPDITPAQIAAVLGWVAAQLVAFGLLDTQKSQALVSGGATIIAALLKLSDALIRNGRAKIAAAALSNGAAPVAAPASQPTTIAPSP